jgi:hypothetical protein
VSDVANSEIDSNRKELKDLTSLGVLSPDAAQSPSGWPVGRVFLIVSNEFAVLLRKRAGSAVKYKRHYTYQEHPTETRTSIFEVLPTVLS